jgi:hypothetical protein
MTHPCCQQCLCWCPQTFLTLQCPLPCAYGRKLLTYRSTLPGKQSSMCMPTLHQSSASIPQQIALACQSRCRRSWSRQSEQSLVMHRSTCCMAQTQGQTAQEQLQPRTAQWQTAPPCQAHQQRQLRQPPDGQHKPAAEYWKVPSAAPGVLNEPPRTPLSIASVSQCQWAPGEAEAGGIVCSPASWAMACHCFPRDTPCYPGRGCTLV